MTVGRAKDDADGKAWRALATRVDAPLFVVTAAAGGDRSGCLVGFASQVSIEPFHFMVCISVVNHTYPVACSAEVLGVHLLGTGQRDAAELFGEVTGDRDDKFARCAWHPGAHGAPLLNRCAAWMEGRVLERIRLGDHVGMVLEPLDGAAGTAHGVLAMSEVGHLVAGHPA